MDFVGAEYMCILFMYVYALCNNSIARSDSVVFELLEYSEHLIHKD